MDLGRVSVPRPKRVSALLVLVLHWSKMSAPSNQQRNPAGGGHFLEGIMLLTGAGLLLWLVVLPVWLSHSAADWVEKPCVIKVSKVDEIRSNVGSSSTRHDYFVAVHFRYEYGGRTFVSEEMDLSGLQEFSRSAAHAKVARYPVGAKAVCFVCPRIPKRAVLDRGVKIREIWAVCMGLGMFCFGLWGFVGPLLRRRSEAQ